MQEITPEQKLHLETWAGQRDSLLSEISILQTQKEKLLEDVKNISLSYSDLEARVNKISGRIEELEKRDAERPSMISREIAELEKERSVAEIAVTNVLKNIELLSIQKASLEKDVSLAMDNFNLLKDEALVLDKIVDHVTVVSEGNTKRMNDLIDSLAKSLEEIVAVNKKNVFETNVVIEKLPAMLMEAQKHGLIKPRNNVLRVK